MLNLQSLDLLGFSSTRKLKMKCAFTCFYVVNKSCHHVSFTDTSVFLHLIIMLFLSSCLDLNRQLPNDVLIKSKIK